jgi:hypothetical protein
MRRTGRQRHGGPGRRNTSSWPAARCGSSSRTGCGGGGRRSRYAKARGHFPGDDAAVKLLWLAIINIEDKRAREREARRQETGKRSGQPARIVEGQRVMGWREALNELDIAYPERLR